MPSQAKTGKMDFKLGNFERGLPRLWERIGAQGDLSAALAEWDSSHNASDPLGSTL
jgi:hypothetical protein